MAKFAYWVGHSGQKFHLSSHRLIIATELQCIQYTNTQKMWQEYLEHKINLVHTQLLS